MAFNRFENIEQVITKYPLKIHKGKFLPAVEKPLPSCFVEDLNFLMDMKSIDENESFYDESLIFPFLREAWKGHRKLKLWIRRPLVYDDELSGELDYLLSSLPEDNEVIDKLINKPTLAVTKVKTEDFTRGWAQCLAEMIACQKINDNPEITIYGIVSTGLMWEFCKMEGNTLIKDPMSCFINNPQQLFGNLDFVFAECEKQLN